MNIIDGKKIATEIRDGVKKEISSLRITPGLAVILVGADPASHLYVSLKERASKEAGIHFEKYLFFATEPQEKIIQKIKDLNADPKINGILVQLPLPSQFNENKIIESISPEKDVDGFHPKNIEKLLSGKKTIVSPLISGIMELIGSTDKEIKNKRIAILANSKIFAEPLQKMFKGSDVRITLSPADPEPFVRNADIIIIALGRPNLLKGDIINKEAIIIDIGTNHLPDGSTTGDVDIESFREKKCWVTPVPGGVGPMTVAMLLHNILEMAKNQSGVSPE
ncbi:hypothetical protein A2316_00355 [Candidatus Falkowbacteria bacterium RIFOXYB2_FULL_38_15]|uniref:Bifunctional protein FolD n=1 Tax=Candidatus Falkowbacteria bacterium RIFOXYA2_FULL_38_12 TaxID=1797993 RepID=A0A1F5S1I0_9BACT|nr:MAG: hypothetical protein A2257_04310 [Candidatus Falkowbacteria bacterium RIFOXYA2_FULL_38_12]OGF32849.1 MAG: hypothetical protein A2316_00355 [Candidatus Falkowbacteria bacterium RIFOXYB2_FULL_38_15]OGF43986.1 MAG: hypothetical protein A2555_01085 [Candidatus Falkowbacteria bacterium RIFOXYD2_FULL_39_16]